MAKPPTQLTELIRGARGTAEQVWALVRSGSISKRAPASAVAEIIDQVAEEQDARGPGWCGPDLADEVADRLAAAGLLSELGERRRVSPPSAPRRGLRRFFAWWRAN